MKAVIGYVCIFMAFIVICTFCGGLFGIAAGGTFSDSVAGFGRTMNQVKHGLIDPLNEFLSYFGLSSSYGGSSVVYRLENDEQDLKFTSLIPDQAFYAAYVMIYDSSDKNYSRSMLNPFYVFFDADGNPISCIMLRHNDHQYIVKPGEGFALDFHQFISLDCTSCYFNSYSKFLYFDVDITCSYLGSETRVINCSIDSPLLEYQYAGNFTDLNARLSKVK